MGLAAILELKYGAYKGGVRPERIPRNLGRRPNPYDPPLPLLGCRINLAGLVRGLGRCKLLQPLCALPDPAPWGRYR